MTDESKHAKKPWMKFYWTDWRADPALRMCSFGARGLWADMISLMHEAEPYGHLLVKGKAPTAKQLAGLLGGGEKEIAALLEELRDNEVFSLTPDGVIFSRRMLRDLEKQVKGRENGLTGGNPKLKKQDKGSNAKSDEDGYPGGLRGRDNTQRPEARGQSPDKEKSSSPVGAAAPRELPLDRLAKLLGLDHKAIYRLPKFAAFPAAYTEWIQSGCEPERDIWPTIEKLAKRSKNISSPRFFESAVLEARDLRLASMPSPIETWSPRVEAYRAHGRWDRKHWGPTPDEPGCKAPAELVQQGAA